MHRILALLTAMALFLPLPGAAAEPATAKATFAGGCFWCMEPPFDEVEGVISTTSGYIGGNTANPNYAEVSSGTSGHAEAVQVVFDPAKVSFEKLLVIFWHNIDPTVKDRQFCDIGSQYRTAVFYHDENQKRLASESKEALERAFFMHPLATQIVAADTFYPAEDYHQDYYLKNPLRYKYYRYSCGRDQTLRTIWSKSPAP